MIEYLAAVTIFAAYWLVVEHLKRRGTLEKLNVTAYGPLLMVRTSKMLGFIERLSSPKALWRIFADLGLPLMFCGMGFMFALLVLADYVMLTKPIGPSEYTSVRAAILIPGINPFVPLVWGTIGLIVTLMVHEFSHAVLCRVEGVRVKALGVLLALIPIGGFAEPDEEELMSERTSRRSRIRIFAAGVTSNFVVAVIAFSIFFHSLGALHPLVAIVDDAGNVKGIILNVNGVKVRTIDDVKALNTSRLLFSIADDGIEELEVPNIWGVKIIGLYREGNVTYPAEIAGIKKGDVIVAIDGEKVGDYSTFRKLMGEKKAGEDITISVLRNGEILNFTLKPVEKGGRAFIGVYVSSTACVGGLNLFYSGDMLNYLRSIPSMATNPLNWFVLISMPFSFQGFMGRYRILFDAPEYVFWILNAAYWVAWINFYVGLFNCLPAVPLDGGKVLSEILTAAFGRVGREELSRIIVRFLATLVFLSILLMILVPNIRGLL